jgi:hypothetical protein
MESWKSRPEYRVDAVGNVTPIVYKKVYDKKQLAAKRAEIKKKQKKGVPLTESEDELCVEHNWE